MAGTLVLDTLQNGAGTASTSADNVINGCAKAWVNFNGITTTTIRASYNVSSVTRTATGTYTVNFTTAFADANYSIVGTAVPYSNGSSVAAFALQAYNTGTLQTASAAYIAVSGTGGTSAAADSNQICVAVFR